MIRRVELMSRELASRIWADVAKIVPNLISRKHTNSAATVLYAFFGLRLLYIAWRSDSKASQKKETEKETWIGPETFYYFR